VCAALRARGLPFTLVSPHLLDRRDRRTLEQADLVVSVGGDGTFLGAARYVGKGLVLGVNSAPGDSVGHFCATERRAFPALLDRVLGGAAKEGLLARLEVWLDGRRVLSRVLNDVLVAHAVPAATTRYEIVVAGRRETHRSSGVWVATAAGSTAGIRSAGGRVIPRFSQSSLQYRVRELYREPGRSYRLTGGVLTGGRALEIVSRMPKGRFYADGARRVRGFPFGACAAFRIGAEPLRIVLRQS
jgi:NAD+ kinase